MNSRQFFMIKILYDYFYALHIDSCKMGNLQLDYIKSKNLSFLKALLFIIASEKEVIEKFKGCDKQTADTKNIKR